MKGFEKTEEAVKKTNEDFLGVLKIWHESAKKNRQIFDWQWYLYDNFYKGNHYIQFNKTTHQIVTPPRPRGQVRMVVNKIYPTLRAIRNFATSNRPRWEVTANSTSEEDINSSRQSAEALDYYYDYLNMPGKIKGSCLYALKYGVAYFQYGWDEDATGLDNQAGEVDVWIRDPFDVYPDPVGMQTGDIQNCRFVDIAVKKPIQDILNNKHYKTLQDYDISGDTKNSASDFKNMLIQNQYLNNESSSKELKTAILHETYYKKQTTKPVEGDEDTKVSDTEVWVASWIEGHLLRDEVTENNKYPIISYSSDNNPNELFGEGYVKHLIPVQKVLNRLESQAVEFNNIVNKGRFITDKGSGVSKISNLTGEIITKKKGYELTPLNMGNLSSDLYRQIERCNEYFQEISGVRDAMMGASPSGVKCVDKDTEALTLNGFKRYTELKKGELIYTINQKTLRGEWKPLQDIHIYPDYQGEIYNIEGLHISARVTPNHKWFVQKYIGGNGVKKAPHLLLKTKDFKNATGIILGAKLQEEKIPVYSDDFVSLVGWVITEGTYRKSGKVGGYSTVISISQSYKRNPDKVEIIKNLVSNLTEKWYMRTVEQTNSNQFIFSGELGKTIRNLFPDKILTHAFVNALTVKQLKLLRKAMIDGDGSTKGNQERFFSTKESEVDMFQYICILLGENCKSQKYLRSKQNPKWLDYWECYVKKSKYAYPNNTSRQNKENKQYVFEIENFSGLVWCPQTESGTFVARRNGKVYFTGNSGVAIESLKAQSANNLQDLKDNIEEALGKLGEGILEMVANKYLVARQIQTTKDGEANNFKIKGQIGTEPGEELEEGTSVIGNQNRVSVSIGSGLAYTKEGKIMRLDNLIDRKIIGPETYLKAIEFGDIKTVIQEAKQSAFDSAMMENFAGTPGAAMGMPIPPGMAQMPEGQGQGAPQAPQGEPEEEGELEQWAALAQTENEAMLAGEELPPTPDAIKEHTMVHISASQADEAQADDEYARRLLTHIEGEESAQGMGAEGGEVGPE